ncbi:MAG: ABC transporter permease [Streptosporangiales bacterium]|nr:ABC transporter permease [Streptosporangiales bacterium]
MSTLAHTVTDSATMLRRNIKRMIRYPGLTVFMVGGPIVFLLLFVYVFGGTLGAGLGGVSGGRAEYLRYVVPGIMLIAVTGAATGPAITVNMDMTEGIIARFRTMAISRAAVLTGHVLGSVLQTVVALVVVTGLAVALGFRSDASVLEWVAVLGILVLLSFALTWLAVGCGLIAGSPETASNLPMPLVALPFLGSGFVPTESMPAALRWFAEYQPFTPVIETIRGLLLGTPIGNSAVVAVAWCVAIALASYLWSRSMYNRKTVR